jgi:dTDP-4-amino-4,6-dideoxygalactose transaminase
MQGLSVAELIQGHPADSSIPLFRVLMSPRAKEHAARVLDSGYVGQGPEVDVFERELGAALGVPSHQVVTASSCTSALTLALHLVRVGVGEEVITTPMTCSATNCPILTRGARPVWADVDAETGLIAPADVARKVTSRTRAIIAVDWGGHLCDYSALREAAPGIPIIQDAAQRAPASLSAGACGDYVCLSFQAIKFLTTCDGGALVCAGPDAERARLLRWYGLDRRLSGEERVDQSITDAGYKFHMNDLAAAIGRANLPYVPWSLARHRSNAAFYDRELRGLRGVDLPAVNADAHYWLYTVRVGDPRRFIQHLAGLGIHASRVHKRNDEHPAFAFPSGPLPGVDRFSAQEVAIPVGWWLEEGERVRVADAVASWARMV